MEVPISNIHSINSIVCTRFVLTTKLTLFSVICKWQFSALHTLILFTACVHRSHSYSQPLSDRNRQLHRCQNVLHKNCYQLHVIAWHGRILLNAQYCKYSNLFKKYNLCDACCVSSYIHFYITGFIQWTGKQILLLACTWWVRWMITASADK